MEPCAGGGAESGEAFDIVDGGVCGRASLIEGSIGPDVSELGFWTAAISRAYLSAACLSQLIVRQHSGGVSWGAW